MGETRSRMEHHLHTGVHEILHWLYDPAAWGRKAYRVRYPWLHIRLIPGRWIDRACDRYDRRLGLTETEIKNYRPSGSTASKEQP